MRLSLAKSEAGELAPLEELPWRDPESVSNPFNVEEADISFAALDAADVRAVEIAGERESFLRKAFLGAQLAHPPTELCLDRFVPFSDHEIMESSMITISPRTLRTVEHTAEPRELILIPCPACYHDAMPEDGPLELDDRIVWYKNGNIHREDGPAIEFTDGSSGY